jgi:nitrite reductase/ring-hydroxylating ferredoxin subunit/uncharacterized membrane protein
MPWLDRAAEILKSVSDPVFGPNGPQAVKDALYGTWLGHPLHPLATDLPIGFWTSSMFLDMAGKNKAADLTLQLGAVSALGAAATGIAQWHDLQEMDEPRRLGALHATLNTTALGLYGVSWWLRANDSREAGRVCSTVAYGIACTSAWIGGDLSFRLGIGVSRIAFEEPSSKWVTVLPETELSEGKLTRVEAKGIPIVLYKQGAKIMAITATCTHVGGPLDEGKVENGCVVCPWHNSHFDLDTGRVVHGPATDDARDYETRIENGQIQVRPAA